MYVEYGSWSRIDIDALLALIPEQSHDKAQYIIESYVNSAYDEGYSIGEEYGEENADITHRVDDWIRHGDWDDEVRARAEALGYVNQSETITKGNEMLQKLHREKHAEGPWYYTFCERCM